MTEDQTYKVTVSVTVAADEDPRTFNKDVSIDFVGKYMIPCHAFRKRRIVAFKF